MGAKRNNRVAVDILHIIVVNIILVVHALRLSNFMLSSLF